MNSIIRDQSVIKEMIDNKSIELLNVFIDLLDGDSINFLNNPTFNSKIVINCLPDQAVILDKMYIIAEYTISSDSSLENDVECRIRPNTILNMIQDFTFNNKSYTFQLNSKNLCKTIPLWGNQGELINVGPNITNQQKFYKKIPLSMIIPLTDKLHLLNDQINLNISFFYDPMQVFSNSRIITEFTMTKLSLYHDILKFIQPNNFPHFDI